MTNPKLSRRGLLTGALVGVAGAAVAGCSTPGGASAEAPPGSSTPTSGTNLIGTETEQFHGAHQAGVATRPQAHASFVALTLHTDVDRAAAGRWMRLLSDDARRLMSGSVVLADNEPELGTLPARLTATVGFGPGFFAAVGLPDRRPESLQPLPPYAIDKLRKEWTGGDVLLQVCSDDPISLAHAERMLLKDSRAFASIAWVQRGFQRSAGTTEVGTTPRNLMGQVDGTVNPAAGTPAFEGAVWSRQPGWFAGGTLAVIRRISMNLDTWDKVARDGRELAIGRRLDTGAPLTGAAERDEPDFAATDELGLEVIPRFAHIRRARGDANGPQFLRRPYSYSTGPDDQGLIFVAYQADIAKQFLPVQQRLAELDLLNTWTTPIGSAVFAIPPGVAEDGWIGDSLLG